MIGRARTDRLTRRKIGNGPWTSALARFLPENKIPLEPSLVAARGGCYEPRTPYARDALLRPESAPAFASTGWSRETHTGSTMQDSFDITTLIFIVLAIFVAWRLRSVLGQKTGHEQQPFAPLSRREPPLRSDVPPGERDNVVRLPS